MAQYSSLQDHSSTVTSIGDDRHQDAPGPSDEGHEVPPKTPVRTQRFELGDLVSPDTSLPANKTSCSAMARIGWLAVLTLVSTSLVIVGAVVFLAFLWTGNINNETWHEIMVQEWATRAVTMTALAVRTSVGFQAGIAVAMLASLLLESSGGIGLAHAPMLSVVRATEAVSVFLLQPVLAGITPSNAIYTLLLALLVATSTLLQFGSTVLISDLKLGQLPGYSLDRSTVYDFAYTNFSEVGDAEGANMGMAYRDTSGDWRLTTPPATTWQRPPAMYPTFAEYTESIQTPAGVDDTGVLLRAFLPFADAQSRENLHSYSGKALVLDARVSCQPPDLHNFSVSLDWPQSMLAYYTGTFLPSRNDVPGLWSPSTLWHSPHPVNFNCSIDFSAGVYLCLNTTLNGVPYKDGRLNGGLLSHFSNITDPTTIGPLLKAANASLNEKILPSVPVNTWGFKYLMFSNGNFSSYFSDEYSSMPYIPDEFSAMEDGPWSMMRDKNVSNSYDGSGPYGINVTVCYTAWDVERLPVNMSSDSNRTEPTFSLDPEFNILSDAQIPHQLGAVPNPGNHSERGILTLNKASSWIPASEDWLVEPPFVEELAFSFDNGGSNTVYEISQTALFSKDPDPISITDDLHLTRVDGKIRKLFRKAIEGTNSPARALSATITILSTMAYYDQMPFFEQNETTKQSFYMTVLFPQSHRGLTAFLAVLATHLVLVGITTIAFIAQSRYTFLGNYWQAIAQLHSSETQDVLADSMLKDGAVAKKIKKLKHARVGLGVDSRRGEEPGRVELVRRRLGK